MGSLETIMGMIRANIPKPSHDQAAFGSAPSIEVFAPPFNPAIKGEAPINTSLFGSILLHLVRIFQWVSLPLFHLSLGVAGLALSPALGEFIRREMLGTHTTFSGNTHSNSHILSGL
jgi:hypothetical protein